MQILKSVPNGILWLLESNSSIVSNYKSEAAKQGVNPDRIIFSKFLNNHDEHLSRYTLADLFLDTFPVNAHTTAGDALWAGLPLLTRKGQCFSARVAASLLSAVGLPELIVKNDSEYISMAIELAKNPEKLKNLQQKLDKNKLTFPLFDTVRFSFNLEFAYQSVMSRYWNGYAPDHFSFANQYDIP